MSRWHEFPYLGSNISLTESDVNICIAKAWTAIDRLSVIWKFDRDFFQAVVVSALLYGCTSLTLTKCMEKKLDVNYTKMLRAFLNKSGKQPPHKTAVVRTLTSHLANHPSETNKTCWVLLVKLGWIQKRRSSVDYYIWTYQCKDVHTSALCGHCVRSREHAKIDERQGWLVRETQRPPGYQHDLMLMMMMIYCRYIIIIVVF